MHLVLCPGGLPPLPLDLGPARGVGVLLDYCLLLASALSLRWLLQELAKGELLDRRGLFLCPLRSSVVSHHSSPHARRRGELWEILEDCYCVYPLVVPELRIVVHEWIGEQSFLLSLLFPLAVRGRGRSSSRSLSARERWRSSDRYLSQRVRSQFRGDRSRFSDRYRSRCARSRSFDRYRSHRRRACSLPAGEIGVTASGHTLSRVALVTASGYAGDYLPLLPARRQKS